MVIVICPKCNRTGSLVSFSDESGEKKYWRVFHSNKENCYFSRNPEETFTRVLDKHSVPIKTGEEIEVDDDTSVKGM